MFFLATLWRILHVSIVLLWGPGEAQSGYSNTILDLVFLGEAQWKKARKLQDAQAEQLTSLQA